MGTRQLLDDFYRFACEHTNGEDSEFSLDELYQVWRAQHPTQEELLENVAAINRAYADFKAGDRGVPALEHHREACRKLGLVIDG